MVKQYGSALDTRKEERGKEGGIAKVKIRRDGMHKMHPFYPKVRSPDGE